MEYNCKFYEPITETQARIVGETECGDLITYPEEVLVAEFCHHKYDYITSCKGCKYNKENKNE